ncbi:MAG: serine/threonine protein kinase [Planctomycetaceae bacterium]|jgi:serine/threonine protein kinase
MKSSSSDLHSGSDQEAEPGASREVAIECLVDRWEAAWSDGREISPEELCQDHPELLGDVREQIAALKWIPSPHRFEQSGSENDAHCGAATHVRFGAETVLAGRYRLVEPVGEGGFGTVWRGFDTELQRFVAIKIPRGLRARSLTNDRFLAEARRLAKLRHSGIVPVFDVGRHDDVVFIVSDFINGHTLTEALASGAIPTPRLIAVITQLADALHAAHLQGFIHRDVKPANILMDGNDQAYLTDFGIAVETDSQLTLPGLSGTLSYMAPEQARGEGEPVDARTDVFALGVVLYELLTGRRPFVADSNSELRQQIINAQPVAPRELDRKISPRLAAVCLRALARDPADRFASALDMAKAVQDSVISRPLQRRAAVAIAVTVIAAVAVAVSFIVDRESWRSEPVATSPQSIAPAPESASSGTLPTSGSAPARDRIDNATKITAARGATPAADAAPASVTATQVFRGHTGSISSLSISADGRRVLSGSWDKTMRLWDAQTGESIREFHGHTEGIGGVALSPDGRRAASGAGHLYRDATLRIWDVDTGRSLHEFAGHAHNIMAVAWAPNGEFLITSSLDNTIRRWHPESDPQMTLLGSARKADVNRWNGQVWAAAISPDSTRVLAGLRDHTIRLIDAQSGQQLLSLGGHTEQVRSVVFSQNGTQCLSGSLDGTVRLWDLNTGETLFELHPDLGAINTAIFGPDESTILTGGQHHSFTMLDIKTGRLLARFTGHSGPILTLALHPSGTVFSGSHDATLREWPIPTAAATD